MLCLRIDLFLKSSGCRDGLYCGHSVPYHPVQSCGAQEVFPLVMKGAATQSPCILTYGKFEGLTETGRIYEAGKCWFSDLRREREMRK